MKLQHIFVASISTLALLGAGAAQAQADAKAGKAAPATAAQATPAAPLMLTAKQPLPKTVTQLTLIDREPGDAQSRKVETGHAILVHYTGWLYDPSKPDGKGAQFDSSAQSPTPLGFILGAGRVIKGWEQGIPGMKIKGKRTLIIPPALAYGANERPKIPANSTLMFDVELVDIIGGGPAGAAPAQATAAPPPAPVVPPTSLKAGDPLPAAPTALTYIDQTVGEGVIAEAGQTVSVHYTGWLYNSNLPGGKGNKFDSSVDRGQPFRFPLGGGRVIKGWDQGVAGMKPKGKRTLIIPAEFGYGARGAGNGLIPPGATLIFDVELLEINPVNK